jgi:hypothetical protein
MSCPKLLTLQNLPVSRLICMALLRLPTTEILSCSKAAKANTHLSTMYTSPTAHILASAIYYDAGRRHAANRDWNKMTRLQISHELRMRRKLADWESEGEGLSEFEIRMRMVRVTLEEQEEGKRMEEMRARDRQEAEMREREKEDRTRREEQSSERIERIVEAVKKESEREESSRKRKREDGDVEHEVVQSPPWMRMRLASPSSLRSGVVGNGNGLDCGVWGRR